MFRFLVVLAVLALACGYKMQMKLEMPTFKQAACGALAGFFAATSIVAPASALTKAEVLSLSYVQVKGSGLANRCSEVKGEGTINLNKKLKLLDLCIEPTSWQVEETVGTKKGVPAKEFVNTKLMTRQTYSLDGISGDMEVKDGKATFTEKDGIDYAATTVQMPGGERVPFLFSVKNLIAKSSTSGPIKPGFDMGGSFTVPSYRTGLFLDPKGRGTTTGYDFAGALPGLQNGVGGGDTLFNENNKKFDVLSGEIEFAVNRVNEEEGEIAGVFVSNQPGDTDMGGKAPKNILIKGIFYARLEE
ncbi:oxygen-evolving enhancer protein [Ochromonadaceae sp. CCMP2298]|nr:oxygen-evolving enhancer protein [Ochromonadaceae sp. CCMP2298]